MNCLTDRDYIEYTIKSLQLAESCYADNFDEQVLMLWQIMGAQSACDLELRYLLTRLQAIKLLMGCYTRQVDVRTSRSEQHNRGSAKSQANGWSQATSTMSSVGFSDALGTNRYRDVAIGNSNSASDTANWSNSRSRGASRFDDIGSGAGRSDSTAMRSGRSTRFANDNSTSETKSTHTGQRNGCNYSFSQSGTNGMGINVMIAGVSRVATKTASDNWIQESSSSNDIATGKSDALRTSQSRSVNVARSSRTSSSYFNALMDSHDWSTAQSHGEAHSTTSRDASAHSHGLGTGNHQAKDRSEMSSRGDSRASDTSSSSSQATRTGFSVMDDAKAHQRFEHLKQLYDNTQQLIDIKREHMRRSGRIAFGELLTCSMDGFCRIPVAASLQVRTYVSP